jgi:seryl-tRNA synthetase
MAEVFPPVPAVPGLATIHLDSSVPGLALFDDTHETLIDGLRASLDRFAAAESAQRIGVPQVISRVLLERLGYVESFPQLLGTIYSYEGDDRQWREIIPALRRGEPWTQRHEISDVVLLPAVCYHLYPQLSGTELAEPAVFDLTGQCYRHERTSEPGRLRAFRMRELVRIDAPGATLEWRDAWIERARSWLDALGLKVLIEPASDPFFGSAERLMGTMQRAEQLKWELVVKVADGLSQAIVSCNCHKNHFSAEFGFRMSGGEAHTSCIAFGLERIALAVLHRHGTDRTNWPAELTAL